jgi:cytidylate kinase
MGNSLLNYLNGRYGTAPMAKSKEKVAGPVITISREVGSGGLLLAKHLSVELKNNNGFEWNVFSKEVFYKSAQELNMDSDKIKKMLSGGSNNSFDQMLNAFGNKNYKSSEKVVKTVRDVVKSIAINGFCIIVGRGGHIIARDIKNAVHIRIVAPLPHRMESIMKNHNFNEKEAKNYIDKVEQERIAFRKMVLKNEKEQLTDFDLVINEAAFTNQQIVELIIQAMNVKGVMKDYC